MSIKIRSTWSKHSEKTEKIFKIIAFVMIPIGCILFFIFKPTADSGSIFLHPSGFFLGCGGLCLSEYLKSSKYDETTNESKISILSILVYIEWLLGIWALFGLFALFAVFSGEFS